MSDSGRQRLQDVRRSVLRRVPPRVRRTGRVVADAARGVAPQPGRVVNFPADVADRAALRTMLAGSDLHASSEEGRVYLDEALDRFRVTMALIPDLPAGARILELGSNPYFLTRLLRRRGLDVTSANYFGADYPMGPSRQVVQSADGVEEVFDYDHFNVETDVFPYPDGSFDLVLCCEILEHLPADPVHMLTQIHRVLRRESGRLLLTTPNACRLENLYRMYRGDNVYEQLSGYGAYGRHNRVYTVTEVRDLLEACGFVDADVFDLDIHDHSPEWALFPPGARREERGCNIFAVARAGAEARWRYPGWLFVSSHALRRVVRPDVVMGINCDLQTVGFHPPESMGGHLGRWTGAAPEAAVLLDVPEDAEVICVEGLPSPAAAAALTLEVEAGGRTATWRLPTGAPYTLAAPIAPAAGPCTVRLRCTEWSPESLGLSVDVRRLGAFICRVSALPAAEVPIDSLAPDAPLEMAPASLR